MKIKLFRYTDSKIDAIKCVRNAMPSLNLQMAKQLCESLPFEIEVRPEHVDNLRRCFEFDLSDGSDTAALFVAWDALTRDRQAQLLQYLSGLGMLQV